MMSFSLKVSVVAVLFLSLGLAKSEEIAPVNSGTETKLPPAPPVKEAHAVTLEEATKLVMQDTKNKVLAAKTELVDGKKIHVIKVLTLTGHIQHIKIDAATGKILNNSKW